MITEKLVLEIPLLPPATAGGNSRAHWAEKYVDSQTFEDAVFYVCRNVINRIQWKRPWVPFDRVTATVTVVFPEERARDDDNLRIRLKPAQDGLVKAQLVLKDDAKHFKVTDVMIIVDRARSPLTVIEIQGERDDLPIQTSRS